jgi:hypothetical protein
MKRLSIAGVCLAVTLAMSAAATATAAASNPLFVLPGGGAKPAFSSLSGKTKLVVKSGAEVKCESARDTGEVVPGTQRAKNISILFKECATKISGETVKCTSSGQSSGTVKTFQLEGQLGYINESEKKVGLVLKAEVNATANPNTLFAEFSCSVAKVKIRGKERGVSGEKGGIIGEVTPVNKLVDPGSHILGSFAQVTGELWRQSPTALTVLGTTTTELLLETAIAGGGFELSGLAAEDEIFALESVEVCTACAPVAPTINEVNFKNNIEITIDHQKNETREVAMTIEKYGEEYEGAKNNVEWIAGKKNWPVAYAQNTKMIVEEARFSVGAPTRAFLQERIEANSKVVIVGELTLGSTKLTFKGELTVKEVEDQLKDHENYIATKEMESNNPLPAEVRLYEGAKIAWKWTVKEAGVAFEQELGNSEHNIYLTAALPLKQEGTAITTYLTVLDSDTQGVEKETATQPPNETKLISGVWSEFKSKSLGFRWYEVSTGRIRRGGKALTYYTESGTVGKTLKYVGEHKEDGACTGTAVEPLLETGQGQCGAWATLLSYALADEGVSSVVKEIQAKFREPTEGCETVGNCQFLVKNWEFNEGEGSLGGLLPYTALEIKDTEGVEGEGGIKNPRSVFVNHYIVEVKKGSNLLYDPSYGTGPFGGAAPLKTYQENSIAGFCGAFFAPTYEAKCQKAPPASQLTVTLERNFT